MSYETLNTVTEANVAQRSLGHVTLAATTKSTAQRHYVVAVQLARASGLSITEIAQAAGVTREAIYRLLKRAEKRSER